LVGINEVTIIFKVNIKPGTKESKIIGFQGDAVKIALMAILIFKKQQ